MSDVYVLFWFDVEDFITPESDDALKGCIDGLDYHGVKGTFKLVGEKLRVLKERGRDDILTALRKHEVGYHTDFHSVHPTPAEYLEGLSWDDGIREFEKREKAGFDELQQTFGYTPTCYGQPGSSWAPQPYAALRDWGVPVYLDETNQIGLNDQPFWYCGMLNILKLRSHTTRYHLELGEKGLQQGIREFDTLFEELRSGGGGVISIWYHPCEYSTYEFWDGVNFAKGSNPKREKWLSAEVKPRNEMELQLRCFRDYVGHIATRPGVRVLTAKEAYERYADQAKGRMFSLSEIRSIASSLDAALTYYQGDGFALSPAEIFYLVLSELSGLPRLGPRQTLIGLLGPTRTTIGNVTETTMPAFLDAARWACAYMEETGRVPDAVPLPGGSITPKDFFATANRLMEVNGPEHVEIVKGTLPLEGQATGEDAWGWVIFPDGFDAPNIMELAKLQTWSLKPAVIG